MCKRFYLEAHKEIKLRGETLTIVADRYDLKRSGLQRILQGQWRARPGTKARFVLDAVCSYLKITPPASMIDAKEPA